MAIPVVLGADLAAGFLGALAAVVALLVVYGTVEEALEAAGAA